jgi:hypothetical protein
MRALWNDLDDAALRGLRGDWLPHGNGSDTQAGCHNSHDQSVPGHAPAGTPDASARTDQYRQTGCQEGSKQRVRVLDWRRRECWGGRLVVPAQMPAWSSDGLGLRSG